MFLFEINHRFKGYFLNKLRVSLKSLTSNEETQSVFIEKILKKIKSTEIMLKFPLRKYSVHTLKTHNLYFYTRTILN